MSNQHLNITHTVASVAEVAGGPSRSIPALLAGLVELGVVPRLLTSSSKPSIRPTNRFGIKNLTAYEGRFSILKALPGQRLADAISADCKVSSAKFIHTHGAWLAINHASMMAARTCGVPLAIAPRGMLLQWSLMHHKWRKQLAMMLYQRDSLDRASIFFATSQEEADDLRALGIHQAIALVPNGVDVPGVHAPVIFAGANRRTALFLSRLHPKKGLHDLLRAWAKLKPKDWILVVAGPDEGGYQTEMMTLSNSLGISDVTKFIGPVSDDEKWPLYCACELFVLPTYSENFGMAIGEAMACGCAVLTTTGAPWKSLIDENAGWWVPPGEEGIAPALEAALACSESKLAAMGARGKAFVERELTWNIAAEKTIAAYRWLLSGGVRPNHVQA